MKYDVIIVGGGAAGSVLASRLAEDTNTSVLVLEAGKDYPDPDNLPDEIKFGGTRFAESPDSEHNWALRGTITEEQGEIHVAQGKVIGGGSSINGQAMQRALPEDFDNWSAWGNSDWSYDKVLPSSARWKGIWTFRMTSTVPTAPSQCAAGSRHYPLPYRRPFTTPALPRATPLSRTPMAPTPPAWVSPPPTTWEASA